MKRIGDKAARVLLTIFGVKTTIIIGTILTFAVILIAIITGLMGTISTSGGKGSKTNTQCVTYQKDANVAAVGAQLFQNLVLSGLRQISVELLGVGSRSEEHTSELQSR